MKRGSGLGCASLPKKWHARSQIDARAHKPEFVNGVAAVAAVCYRVGYGYTCTWFLRHNYWFIKLNQLKVSFTESLIAQPVSLPLVNYASQTLLVVPQPIAVKHSVSKICLQRNVKSYKVKLHQTHFKHVQCLLHAKTIKMRTVFVEFDAESHELDAKLNYWRCLQACRPAHNPIETSFDICRESCFFALTFLILHRFYSNGLQNARLYMEVNLELNSSLKIKIKNRRMKRSRAEGVAWRKDERQLCNFGFRVCRSGVRSGSRYYKLC